MPCLDFTPTNSVSLIRLSTTDFRPSLVIIKGFLTATTSTEVISWWNTFDTTVETRSWTASSWTVTYNHWGWSIPKKIIATSVTPWTSIDWFSSTWSWLPWDENKSLYNGYSVAWVDSTYAILAMKDTTYWQKWLIQNVTWTQFDVVWTLVWSPLTETIWLHFEFTY